MNILGRSTVVILLVLLVLTATVTFAQQTDSVDRDSADTATQNKANDGAKRADSSKQLFASKLDLPRRPVAPPAASSDSWHFEVSPYLWAAALKGDLRVRNTLTHVDSSFSDVFKQLDFAFATTFEANKGRWRMLLDENYINLGTTGTGPFGNSIKVEPTLNFFEFGVSYAPVVVANKDASDTNPLPPLFSLEIVGGGRYTHFGLGLEPANLAKVEGSRNLVDAFIGNRFKVSPHPAVTLSSRYTVGGGGSKFAWTINGLVDFRFRKGMSAWGGYQVLDMNADQSSNVVGFDGQMRGLIFGMTIHK